MYFIKIAFNSYLSGNLLVFITIFLLGGGCGYEKLLIFIDMDCYIFFLN